MKILLATDGSSCGEMATSEIAKRPWPEQSEVRIISVAEAPFPLSPTQGSAPSLLIDELEQYARNHAGADAIDCCAQRMGRMRHQMCE